ncbi:MAG: metallophosphoesterase [Thaumarchaeota archaeon]|jgi:DNA repair exonuclease SbcCD nuclease subunit|nr:metallophosphoesterase [Candidatus Geocrenenecus arthurdayi]
MLRIGVFSDSHIGRNIPRVVGDARRHAFREAFKQAINIFIDNRVDYVVHGGDLFEKRSMTPDDARFVKDEFYRLVKNSREKWEKDVKIFIVRGNHDGALSSCVLEYITHPLADYLQIIGESIKEELQYYSGGDILVTGIGYHPFIRKKFKDFIGSLSEIVDSSKNNQFKILLLHNYIEGVNIIPPYTPEHSIINREDLEKIQVDIIVVGHYHEKGEVKEKDNLKFIMPGAIEAVDLGEKGPFGVYILDVDDSGRIQAKFIELKPSQHIALRRVFSEEPKPLQWFKDRVLEEISIFMNELSEKKLPGILKIKVSGTASDLKVFPRIFTEEELRGIREDNPNLLYLEIEEDITPIIREESGGVMPISREDLVKDLFKELSQEPSIVELIEETSLTLEEKASEKTGLLKDSDRSVFVERWASILLSKVEADGNED